MSGASTPFESIATLKKIGHITPSSNTVLEPITAAMNVALADQVSHHFTRIHVRQMTLDNSTAAQFEYDGMVQAARLLADSPLDAILWNGTSASWLGVDRDIELCRRITDTTGIPSSTSTLAFLEAFRSRGFRRIALAVPYTAELTERIVETYAQHGITVVSHAELGQTANVDVGNNRPTEIREILRRSDSAAAECIAVVCTNFAATPLVEEMEQELGKPIIDSIAVTMRAGCMLAGVDRQIEGWGALMRGELDAADRSSKAGF